MSIYYTVAQIQKVNPYQILWITNALKSQHENLKKKYNLVSLKENDRTKERLSSISGQRYYFDNALKKALRNYAVKERVMSILSSSGAELLGDRLQKTKLSNEEWMSVLGNHEYDSILSILKKVAS